MAELKIDFTKVAEGFTKTAKEKGMFVGWWIPVSEKLPEVGSEVLVCYDFKDKRSVYIANFYGDGEFHGLDDEYLTSEGRKYRKAVAWMSLPQPYKAESEVQDADSNYDIRGRLQKSTRRQSKREYDAESH